jgi:hypothetical protein
MHISVAYSIAKYVTVQYSTSCLSQTAKLLLSRPTMISRIFNDDDFTEAIIRLPVSK